MMQDIAVIKNLIDKSTEVLVLLPQNPGPDSIAAALSLNLSLEKAGKSSILACASVIDFRQFPLKQVDKFTQKIGNKNLVVSLKIQNRDSVDKVSYNLDEINKVFNLVVSPKKGMPPLEHDAVSFSFAGARADLIFIVGALGFDDLGSIYATEPELFNETPTIAINKLETTPFAMHHFKLPDKFSISETMMEFIELLKLPLETDSATNLLAGIDVATNKLQFASISASTFEAVAKLVRAGGTRIMLELGSEMNDPLSSSHLPSISNKPIPQEWLQPKILKASPIEVNPNNPIQQSPVI